MFSGFARALRAISALTAPRVASALRAQPRKNSHCIARRLLTTATPPPSPSESDPALTFLCISEPAEGVVGERCIELIQASIRNWAAFVASSKAVWGDGQSAESLGTATGLAEFCKVHPDAAHFFQFDTHAGDTLYARRTLGALHVMQSMMQGMPATIDAVATSMGVAEPAVWTKDQMEAIATESTRRFLEHAPSGANTAFIAAFGLHGCDMSATLKNSLRVCFYNLCVNARAVFDSAAAQDKDGE